MDYLERREDFPKSSCLDLTVGIDDENPSISLKQALDCQFDLSPDTMVQEITELLKDGYAESDNMDRDVIRLIRMYINDLSPKDAFAAVEALWRLHLERAEQHTEEEQIRYLCNSGLLTGLREALKVSIDKYYDHPLVNEIFSTLTDLLQFGYDITGIDEMMVLVKHIMYALEKHDVRCDTYPLLSAAAYVLRLKHGTLKQRIAAMSLLALAIRNGKGVDIDASWSSETLISNVISIGTYPECCGNALLVIGSLFSTEYWDQIQPFFENIQKDTLPYKAILPACDAMNVLVTEVLSDEMIPDEMVESLCTVAIGFLSVLVQALDEDEEEQTLTIVASVNELHEHLCEIGRDDLIELFVTQIRNEWQEPLEFMLEHFSTSEIPDDELKPLADLLSLCE